MDQRALTAALGESIESYENEQRVLRVEAQFRQMGIQIRTEEQREVLNSIVLSMEEAQTMEEGRRAKMQAADAAEIFKERVRELNEWRGKGIINEREYIRLLDEARLAERRRAVEQGPAGQLDRGRQFDRLDAKDLQASQRPIDGIKAALFEIRAEIPTTAEFLSDAFVDAWGTAGDALGDFVVNGVYDLETLESAIKGITDSIQKMAITFFMNMAMQGLTDGLLGPSGASAGNAGTAGGGPTALFPNMHRGGFAGDPTASLTRVDPRVFMFAERYHTGGLAGLGPDEVPIIAQRGEPIGWNRMGGMGDVIVNNYSGAPVRREKRRGANGKHEMVLTVGRAWNEFAAGGDASTTMRERFGVKDRLQ
jgi:hypothetical protein